MACCQQLKLGDKEAILRRVRAQVKELESVNTAQRDRLEAMEAKLATLQEAQTILAETEKSSTRSVRLICFLLVFSWIALRFA
eukprot:COSAG05_NODE_29_length_29038_cov_1237.466985_9_plen_83_part_00